MQSKRTILALVPDKIGSAFDRSVIEEVFSLDWLPYKIVGEEETGAAYFLEDLDGEELDRLRLLTKVRIVYPKAQGGKKLWLYFDIDDPLEVYI